MAYIGKSPAAAVLTASDITDAIITKAKLADEVDVFAGTSLTAADIGAGIHIRTADSSASAHANADELVVEGSAASGINILSGTGSDGSIYFGDSGDDNIGMVRYEHSGNNLVFRTNAADALTINSSQAVLIGKTSDAIGTAGKFFSATGANHFTRSGANVIDINRLADDGELMRFFQAGTQEGGISISSSTTAYNTFTGTHWSRLADNSKPTILRGTVMESLDAMVDWYNLEFDNEKIPHVLTDSQSIGDTVTYNHKGTDYQATIVKETDIKHVQSKISTTSEAKNVYGVFFDWDNDGEGYNDFYIASVGSYVVRIKADETIAKGDLLQSNGDGTAKVQSDDNVKSSSFAKILSTTKIETYDDGSFIVPCSLMS